MTCHMCFSLVRTSDYRLQRASPKDGLRVAFICLRFELVRTRFFLEVDFVRRYTNSTLVAEPGRPGLPTCALRDHELFVPAETRGTIGSSSSRSCLVDPSSTCSPHPSRALCPCEQLHATTWSKERQAAGIGIEKVC